MSDDPPPPIHCSLSVHGEKKKRHKPSTPNDLSGVSVPHLIFGFRVRVWEVHRGRRAGDGLRAVGVQRGRVWRGAGAEFVNGFRFFPVTWIWRSCVRCLSRAGARQMLLPVGSSSELFTHPPPLFPTSRLYNIRPYHNKDKVSSSGETCQTERSGAFETDERSREFEGKRVLMGNPFCVHVKVELYRMVRQFHLRTQGGHESSASHPDIVGDRCVGASESKPIKYVFLKKQTP